MELIALLLRWGIVDQVRAGKGSGDPAHDPYALYRFRCDPSKAANMSHSGWLDKV